MYQISKSSYYPIVFFWGGGIFVGDPGKKAFAQYIFLYVYRFLPICKTQTFDSDSCSISNTSVPIFMHGRGRMTIDPRIPTMPGRSTSGYRRPGRQRRDGARRVFTDQADIACTKREAL
ncbi:unnamed protein product [Laminaria digitata]